MQQRSRGHILLMAIFLATLLSILLAMAIRPIRTQGDRQRETELIYRGEHIADGIRRFYFENGRFPFELEELVENEPRFIRKLYPDPMTKSGEWTLVYLTPTDQDLVQTLDRSIQQVLGLGDREQNNESEEKERSVFAQNTRQITGVRSKSDVEGLKVRDESSIYSDWLFSALPKREISFQQAQGK